MNKLYELKEKLMKELEEYSENGKFSREDAESIKYIASAIDHICNIAERDEEEEYSQRGGGRSNRAYSYRRGQEMRERRYNSRGMDGQGYSGHYPMEYNDPMWDRRY